MTQVLTITITIEVPDGVTVAAAAPAAAHVERPAAPERSERPGPVATGYRLGHAQTAVLTALADRHGRLADPTGHAVAKLAEIAGSPSVNQCAGVLRKLDDLGLVERTLPSARRTSRVVLTPKGWEAIGRSPVRAEDIDTSTAEPAAPSPAPAMPVLGRIERRSFDPDRVRENGASAL